MPHPLNPPQVFSRPAFQDLLNVSLTPMFTAFAIFGPLLTFFHFHIVLVEQNSFNCARFMEMRTIIIQSLLHVVMNLLCRFFYIVHADKGLLVSINTTESSLQTNLK